MDKQTAIDLLDNLLGMVEDNHDSDYDTAIKMGIDALNGKMQLSKEDATKDATFDCISRRAAINAMWKALHEYEDNTEKQFQESDELDVDDWIVHRGFVQDMNDIDRQTILNLPSVQPEPLSDAYMKAVYTWLVDYQIKVAELQGRYTPYEVLSWVVNDWRKEHE